MFSMRYLSTILALLVCICASAQMQNNNWCFGKDAGITFNNTPPSARPSSVDAREGVASVSDRNTGDLLFYCNTLSLFDASGNNNVNIGTDVNNTASQGVAVVQSMADTNKYLIFTLSSYDEGGYLMLSEHYLPGTAPPSPPNPPALNKVVIDSGFCEAVTIMSGCGVYWVVLQKQISGDFYAYKITDTGLGLTPTVSKVSYADKPLGPLTMKFSPNKKRLATVALANAASTKSYAAVHDFNKVTGAVTNGVIIDEKIIGEYYGCEFSPNSDLLYVSGAGSKHVYQFDLTLGTLAAITGSRKAMMKAGATLGALQMGPDSNIYVSLLNTGALDVISNADNLFPNCKYTPNAISLSGKRGMRGLPQAIVFTSEKTDTLKPVFTDTALCVDGPITIQSRELGDEYVWQDGSTADSLVITKPGTYWVRMLAECRDVADTFVIRERTDTTHSLTAITICPKESVTLHPYKKDSTANYYWSTFSTEDSITVSEEAKYWSRTTIGCVVAFDTFNVDMVDLYIKLRTDTTLCLNDKLTLTNYGIDSGADLRWNTGQNTNTIDVDRAGRYVLHGSYMGCSDSDATVVDYYPEIAIDITGRDELCKGDKADLNAVATGYPDEVKWSDGTTGDELTVYSAGKYTVTATNICQTVSDSILVRGRSCNFFFPSAFTPNGDGKNDRARLVGDLVLVQDFYLRIYNRWGQVVYETQDPTQGWDGRYKGQKAEVGSYYYLLKFTQNGDEEQIKGDLMLVR